MSSSLLVANRGEIAVRILRAATALDLRTVAVHATDEPDATHVQLADAAEPLPGTGPAAYLDAAAIVDAAVRTGCDLLHPGYGFLSESADLAVRCAEAGITFVGPPPDVLSLFADKVRARKLAEDAKVPVLPATEPEPDPASAVARATAFAAEHGPVMVKAVAGGGGRGMREVHDPAALEEALRRCASEAARGFGDGAVYVEKLLPRAKHIEVQILADRTGEVTHLHERDCTVQRRHQKVIEIAPAPWLPDDTRGALLTDAVRMAARAGYAGLGTFEFLVDITTGAHYFIECNPRLQVEHTVTEEITGVDLVAAQIRVARGATLADLELTQDRVPAPRGYAVQARLNAEEVRPDGLTRPGSGTLRTFGTPSGVRIDTHAYAGMTVTGAYDPLLAKIIGHAPDGDLPAAADQTRRAVDRLDIEGVPTNRDLLHDVLADPGFLSGGFDTGFLAGRLPEPAEAQADDAAGPVRELRAPLSGTITTVSAEPGRRVRAGDTLVVLEAMKMEHVVAAPAAGTVTDVPAQVGVTVDEGTVTVVLAVDETGADDAIGDAEADLDHIRPDLAEVLARHESGQDAARPEAVAKRHRLGLRTARENVADLCDAGSFTEYGALGIAAQRRRRTIEDLVANTPHDGMVCGIGTVNAADHPYEKAQVAVLAYDYTVLAGTQGMINHRKTDRVLEMAAERRLPVVLFAEGGGGRPGDTDNMAKMGGLDTPTFATMGRLSGTVPSVGIVTGRCFAGNAALLGCCDVIISTEDANIGMGGPAMIEGGGLGVFKPEDIGPVSVQAPNGVIDVLVKDEAEAVAVAKRYLSYFQGPVRDWTCADQRRLRHVVPENRVRAYDVRVAIDNLADTGSVLELRRDFAAGAITALVRIEGRPYGLIANNPWHLGGAIDTPAADKFARFLQLCDAHGLPVISLCDTPGFMVGPESETTATVRHFGRMFVAGANLSVPLALVVLRKGYGLGAQAMGGGSFKEPIATIAWPTGEIGPMGLEGAVRLGFRRELEAIEDETERQAKFDELLADYYKNGKALNAASVFELDDVIDPADTRRWLSTVLAPRPGDDDRPKRPFIDTW